MKLVLSQIKHSYTDVQRGER
uniref:Uncharacterized protein n=1 Tax=Anguilla anguilla TaxID=7936 RepID=A0A0E9QS51_ANGAN